MGAGSQGFGSSLTAFPGHRQGAGREAGLPRQNRRPYGILGVQGEDLNHCTTAPGPRFIFIGKSDMQRGETERKISHQMMDSPRAAMAGGEPIQSQEPGVSSGSPTWVKVPKGLGHPRLPSQATSWMGSGSAGISSGVPIESQCVQGEDFS